MILRQIRLENVRRFTDPVVIDGIGPGLNVLCEPNEHGKSTVFDALHTLFFFPHRSSAAEVRRLRPHAGGDPVVTVELEVGGRAVRVEKRWLGKASARVWEDGRLVHQADAAEEAIAALLRPLEKGGPTGLLWVEQGRTEFGKPKEDRALAARSDILQEVAGEVDAMTGGRAMEAVLARVEADLGRLVTSRGPKAGGPLAAAVDEVARLAARASELAEAEAALARDIAERAVVRRRLAALEDPNEAAARQARLESATAAHAEAERHRDQVERASGAVREATLAAGQAETALTDLTATLGEIEAATRELGSAETAVTAASARQAETGEALRSARQAHGEARARTEAATGALALANRAARAADAEERRADLSRRIAAARADEAEVQAAAAEVASALPAAVVEGILSLVAAVRPLREATLARAPTVSVRYMPGGAPVSLDGRALGEGERVPLPAGGTLSVPGTGAIDIHVTAADERGLAEAERRLAAALASAGMANVEAVHTADAARRAAERRRDDARARLGAVAPDGIARLAEALARLPAPLEAGIAAPSVAEAEALASASVRAFAAAEAALEATRTADAAAGEALAQATQRRAGLADRLARATARLGPMPPGEELARRQAARAAAADALDRCTAALKALQAAAPDVAATAATLKRAREAIANVEAERQRLAGDLRALDERIRLRGADGIGDEGTATEEALGLARSTEEHWRGEVALLTLLRDALLAAQRDARETYVAPVAGELVPLIETVWPGARVAIDHETLLPSRIIRAGADEGVDILSGGTREQVAILVRLAFARLLAKAGRPAPVILDDAMVYTDDDRIERMFDALVRQAEDQQILVFSCRQRAFRALGGTVLRIAQA
jgi:hypothetical protein